MSDSGFLKCSCSYCQGHIEFPAHALGITTTCPHCGIETTLVAPAGTPAPPPPKPPAPPPVAPATPAPVPTLITPADTASTGSKLKKVLNVVLSVLVGLSVLTFVGIKVWRYFWRAGEVVETVKGDSKPDKPKSQTPSPTAAPMPAPATGPTSVVIAKGSPLARKPGEDLQVLNFDVQKAKDGNLQYIVGVVTNHAAKQYFNVKLEFDVTRKDGKSGDLAIDNIRNLPANGGTTFKANIIGTAPVTSAKLATLKGDIE